MVPENYRCPSSAGWSEWWACQSDLAASTTVILMDNLNDQRTLGTDDVTVWHWTAGGVVYNSKAVAYPIQIRWKAEDRASTPTPTDPGSSTAPTTGAGSGPVESESGQSGEVGGGSSPGLSDGAKIGLGIGLGVLGIIAVVSVFLVWFCLKRRAVRKTQLPVAPDGNYPAPYGKAELGPALPHELQGNVAPRPAELWEGRPH